MNITTVTYSASAMADQGLTGTRTLKGLATSIGSSKQATIVLSHTSSGNTTTYSMSQSVTLTSNITLKIEKGAVLSIAAGKTLTINGSFEAGLYQVFDCVGTGKVSGLKESNPIWFGAKIDNATDDSAAWQAAFDSIPTTGGVLTWPVGTSYVASTLIWPNDGTNAYAIRLKGNSPGSTNGTVATATGGVSAIRYGGTGSLFDMRNGTSANLNWCGSIENGNLWGPADSTEIGLNIYSMKHAVLKNLQIKFFSGYGVYVASAMYYSIIDGLRCYKNGYGLYAAAAAMNGSSITHSVFSVSTNDGLHLAWAGYPVNLAYNFYEGNGGYGANISNAAIVNITGDWFEANTNADLAVSASKFYSAAVNLTGVNFEDNATHNSVYLSGVSIFNSFGSRFGAYSSSKAIEIATQETRGVMSGNIWPKVAGVTPVAAGGYGNFLWNDAQNLGFGNSKSTLNYSTVIPSGTFVQNAAPLSNGGVVGWVYTTPGAGGNVNALSGVTAATTATDATITTSSTGSIPLGAAISIAGVDFGTSALSYAKVVKVISTTSYELDNVANQTVSGAAVSWYRASYKRIGGMIFDRSVSSTSTSGTGEDNLKTTTIPASMMETVSGFKVFAAGTKTGAGGNKTLKFYFGATSVTFHAAANNTNDWRFEAYVYNTGATNTQGISWVGYDGATILQGYDTAAIDTTAAVTMKITGECASAADTITQTLLLVEPM